MRIFSTKTGIRVRYAETDQMHGVSNERYLEYFEVGRAELMRSLGLSYRDFEAAGFHLPIAEAYLKYIRQVKYDDLIEVVASVKELPKARLRIDYEIFRGDERMTEGYTVHSFIDAKTGKPIRAPKMFLDLLDGKT